MRTDYLRRVVARTFIPALALGCGLSALEITAQKTVDPFQLALLLKSGRLYCQRLEKAALDFVCQEEVSEKIDLSLDFKPEFVDRIYPSNPAMVVGSSPGQRPPVGQDARRSESIDNSYLFDYQFIRKAGEVKETRALLEKNRKKAGTKEEPPKTETFQYADILLAPVRLLDERFGEYYDYRLVREDEWKMRKAWVLDIIPRLSVADVYLGGKIWLGQEDSSVLRIDWDPATFGRYETILLRAKKYGMTPRVTSYTEFGFEKNGLRFPSLDVTEEAYVDKDAKRFVRAVTMVVYKEYKFFTVETETEFKK